MSSHWKWIIQESPTQFNRADALILAALKNELGVWDNPPQQTFSRNRVQQLIEQGKIKRNGLLLTKSGTPLQIGNDIELELPELEPLLIEPENIPLEILYQDSHLLVLNKPQGLIVHPATTQKSPTLVHALLYHIKNLSGIGGKIRPGIVHRLDQFTSGALVVAKTDLAHQKLTQAFSRQEVKKIYWALCYGSPKKDIEMETLIGRNPKDRKKMSIQTKNGKKAVTHFRVLKKYFSNKGSPFAALPFAALPFASLIEAQLKTGRTHQIRVHLTALGNSILGDPLYGVASLKQEKWLALPEKIKHKVCTLLGQALHAREISFLHPVTEKEMKFQARPPEAFSDLLEMLRPYAK